MYSLLGWYLSMDFKDSFFHKLGGGEEPFGKFNYKTLGVTVVCQVTSRINTYYFCAILIEQKILFIFKFAALVIIEKTLLLSSLYFSFLHTPAK